MRTSQAARYARWAAAAALLLAVLVAGAFARRVWQARQARQAAPPDVPPAIQQLSAEFSFSKVEKDRTVFTVRASRATQFKEGNNLLEDVWITVYGRTGQRFDNIHTRSCDYQRDTGRIVCAGEVQIDLQSAEEARHGSHPAPDAIVPRRLIHIATRNVSFDRQTGEARTDQPVIFRFPYGEGRAVGVTYDSGHGVVRLTRDVAVTLTPPSAANSDHGGRRNPHLPEQPVTLTGGSLEYLRDKRVMRLLAPVRVRQGQRELTAGELALLLDPGLRPQRLVARRQPELRLAHSRGQALLSADEFVAFLNPEGWAERILVSGDVRGSMTGKSSEELLAADRLEMEFPPGTNQPRVLALHGAVKVQSTRRRLVQRLETTALRLLFATAAKSNESRLDRAETLAPATLTWSAAAGENTRETTVLRGERMAAEFDQQNQLKRLTGQNGVEMERRFEDRPPQVTSSRELVVKFSAGSGWTEMEQSGDVRFREADRTGQADRARLERDSGRLTLTGSVVLSDPLTRTAASTFSFHQRTGEIRAEGSVRTTYLSADRKSVANLSSQPAHIASDVLLADSTTGRAVYSGGARLWQGEAMVQADSIELLRETRQLNAHGNVLALFPQAGGARDRAPGAIPAGAKTTSRIEGAESDLWRIRSGMLRYWSAEGRVLLEQDVSAQTRRAQMFAKRLELLLSSRESLSGATVASGPQQVIRAVASGGVTILQGERRGVAERAEYAAAQGKFVLSGGSPTLHDASRGTITGHELTFIFADDTIVVGSGRGSRTLTRHQVEK